MQQYPITQGPAVTYDLLCIAFIPLFAKLISDRIGEAKKKHTALAPHHLLLTSNPNSELGQSENGLFIKLFSSVLSIRQQM